MRKIDQGGTDTILASEVFGKGLMFKDLYEKAKMGDVQAQYTLGMTYETGLGIPQSDVNAIMWYIKAANQDLPAAQYKLGLLYRAGKGCPIDPDLARQWLSRAAEQGHTEAANLLKKLGPSNASMKCVTEQAPPQKKMQTRLPSERLDSFSPKEYQSLLIQVLQSRPNQSCKKDDLTKHSLKLLDVMLLGHLRDDFTRKINTALGVLKRQRIVEEYTSKNVRVRLVENVPIQDELPFLFAPKGPKEHAQSFSEEYPKMVQPIVEVEATKTATQSAPHHPQLAPSPVADLVTERIKQRMLDVLDYIKEAENVGKKPPYRMAEYKRELFYQQELEGLPGITFNIDDGEAWMKVARLKRNPPPDPPAILAPFIRLADDPKKQPELNEDEVFRLLADEESEISEKDAEAIFEGFQAYLQVTWERWSIGELPRRRTINAYERLFAIQRTIYADNAADPIELIWGIGVTVWKHSGGIIQFPVLLQLVEIEIDPKTMILSVRPRDKDPLIGLAPFFDLENENAVQVKQVIGDFLAASEASLSPFAADTYEGALRACAMLDSGAVYWPDREESRENPLPKAQEELRITDTWAIFVRPKTAHFLEQDIEALG